MTNMLHDYPELAAAEPPKPVEQQQCAYCAGTGWRESHIDDRGLGHGDRCVHCGGRGIVWVELDELRDQAAEARRRLTRARYLP